MSAAVEDRRGSDLLSLLRRQLAPYRGWIAAIVGLQLVGVIASLLLPSLNASIIDDGISEGDTGLIWRIGAWMLLVALISVIASISAAYFGARTAMAFGRDTRAAVFHQVGSFSAQEMHRFGAPSLITRTTNDVQQVQLLVVMAATIFVSAPIMGIGGLAMALREDVGISWVIAAALPVLAIAIGSIVRRMVPNFRLMQGRIDQVNRILREQLSGVRVVRAFVREPQEIQRYGAANRQLTDVSIRAGLLMAAMFPTVMLVLNVTTVAVWWFGARRIDGGDMQIGELAASATYLIQILMAVMMAGFLFMMIPRATVCAERIEEVLRAEPTVRPPRDPSPIRALRGVVELDDVELRYPGAEQPVLCDISLHASPGQTVAIVGSTGSGKTTLLSLIARRIDATGGDVRIDGVDVRDLDPDVLWGHLGAVPQQPYLFTGTVATNLRFGRPDATDADLWEALAVAQADDFVRRMDGGLDAPIAQGGTNVSGGQRQRLCIARALVARPSIYLFDDSFSALDLATDARLRAALGPHVVNATVFIVAQRVSTIVDADEIIVLEDGRIVGRGTHTELSATSPTYQEIIDSQQRTGSAA
ncbi:MAG: ABC transporter ATP-binding protein [Desertimonas sp.]